MRTEPVLIGSMRIATCQHLREFRSRMQYNQRALSQGYSSARELSRVLRQNGIAHQFEEFEGSTKIGQLSAFKARFCRSSRENFSTGRLRSNMYTRESKELRPGCVFSLSITGKLDIGRGQSESRRPRQHRANAALLWPRTQFFSPRR